MSHMEVIERLINRLSFLTDKEQYGSALELYEKKAPVHLNSSTSLRDRKALLLLGAKIYYFNQMYESSSACLSELESQLDEIESNIEFIGIKFLILTTTGKPAEALEFIAQALNSEWPKDEYHRLNFYLGIAHFMRGDYLRANHCFQQCYRHYLSTPDQYMLGSVSYMLGYTAFQRSFFEIANAYYERALEYYEATEKNYQIGVTHHVMGILAYRTGRYSDAAKQCRLARVHFEKCKSKVGIINSDIAMARISIFRESYHESGPILEKSYYESKDICYKRGEALSAEFLGEIHYHQADYARSLHYLEIAEKLALEIAPSGDIAVEVYRRLGDLFIAREELERAEAYLSKALEIGEHLNDRYELGSIYRAFGLLFARKNNIDRARSFFMESIVTLQVIKESYELARTYITAADTYRKWCRANNLPDEYKNELLLDADTYEIEAMHLYQSIGLDHKVTECESRRRESKKDLPRKYVSKFVDINIDKSWLHQGRIIAKSTLMREVISKAEKLASCAIAVFITGETGTGKEVIARLLHQLSDRSPGPFIAVNCALIPDTVFESELFGHKKGSFTGAINDKAGLIEQASGGTLFLDEISELTDRQQAKLLRTLEGSSIRRVGDTRERPVAVRVVSASNKNISELLDSGKLRTDFFFRISVERIELAPLRERRDDIIPLFAYYLHTLCGSCEIEGDIPELLERYHWPGNVRELINIVKALAQLRGGDGVIRTSDLPLRIRDYNSSELKTTGERFIDKLQIRRLLTSDSCRSNPDQIRELIVSSLERCNGNCSAAARELGIARTTLYRRMQELDLI